MSYRIDHRKLAWYLYGCRIKLANGELGYRYFFSTKDTPRGHWDVIDNIPDGWEVSRKGWMPMLAKKKQDLKENKSQSKT